jgi:hypothetical protein
MACTRGQTPSHSRMLTRTPHCMHSSSTADEPCIPVSCRILLQGVPLPDEGPPPHHLQDIPRLLFAAGVSALRRPARLLLPPTAVLFIARCAGEVATAALKVQDGALALAAGAVACCVHCMIIVTHGV